MHFKSWLEVCGILCKLCSISFNRNARAATDGALT
jgi:hypothetical protein